MIPLRSVSLISLALALAACSPSGLPPRSVQIAATDGIHIAADAEGAALIPVGETGGYLVVSSQSDNTFAVYDLETHSYVTRLAITDGEIDGVTHTDGHDMSVADLGPLFPGGVWVAQDDENDSGGQNFKFVDLRDVLAEIEAARTEGLEAH